MSYNAPFIATYPLVVKQAVEHCLCNKSEIVVRAAHLALYWLYKQRQTKKLQDLKSS